MSLLPHMPQAVGLRECCTPRARFPSLCCQMGAVEVYFYLLCLPPPLPPPFSFGPEPGHGRGLLRSEEPLGLMEARGIAPLSSQPSRHLAPLPPSRRLATPPCPPRWRQERGRGKHSRDPQRRRRTNPLPPPADAQARRGGAGRAQSGACAVRWGGREREEGGVAAGGGGRGAEQPRSRRRRRGHLSGSSQHSGPASTPPGSTSAVPSLVRGAGRPVRSGPGLPGSPHHVRARPQQAADHRAHRQG